jgi:hypothetical protein
MRIPNTAGPAVTSGAAGPPPIREPSSKPELLRDLAAVREWSMGFWRRFGLDEIFAPLGDAWSPADNVRHLIKSNRPVATALAAPRLLLMLRFGIARRPSRSYSVVRDVYHQALADGLEAGRYAARPLAVEQQTAAERERVLATLDGTLSALGRGLTGWSERTLDRLRLPHPGIGLLTMREMVGWTLYHNAHHVANVERLLAAKR